MLYECYYDDIFHVNSTHLIQSTYECYYDVAKGYSSMSTHTQHTHTCVCVYMCVCVCMHTPAHLLGKLGFHFFFPYLVYRVLFHSTTKSI